MPIKFYLENRPNKKGECMIRVSIMIKSNRLITSIGNGYTIAPNKWDTAKQCVKKGCFNSRGLSYAEINNRINRIASEFQNLESEAIGGKEIQSDTIKTVWHEKFGKPKNSTEQTSVLNTDDPSVFPIFDRFIIQQKKISSWHWKTEEKFKNIKNKLTAFNPHLRFEDVSREMLANYCEYLVKCNMVNTTIKKHIIDLRQFFRWAINEQIIAASPIMSYNPKLDTAKKPIIFLEWEELMNLYRYKFKESEIHLERVRDCFVFQCFTGLRYSDLYNLRRLDIRGNSIFVTTIKTLDSLEIQLNDYSREILAKYGDEQYPDHKALPVISNRRMNETLKVICELVGIKTPIRLTICQGTERREMIQPKYDLIGTHCGRRTFISNAIMLGIAPDIVMKWTGHSGYEAMKPYIEIANKAKVEAMDLFNKR